MAQEVNNQSMQVPVGSNSNNRRMQNDLVSARNAITTLTNPFSYSNAVMGAVNDPVGTAVNAGTNIITAPIRGINRVLSWFQ